MAHSATCCLHMGPLQLQAPASTVILLLASVLVVGSLAREAPSSSVYTFELIHVNANSSGGFTKDGELARSADDSTYVDTASYSEQEYLMELKIGTPPKSFKAIVDTGSEVIWTKRMELCTPGASSSFDSMTCSRKDCNQCNKDGQCVFHREYGSKKKVAEGFMAHDKLTLSRMGGGPEAVPKPAISFGCARCDDDNGCHGLIPTSADGIVGLNRGPNSLLTQLDATRFSYCLSDPLKPEKSSPLWFGRGDDLELSRPRWWRFWEAIVQTTPLVKKGNKYNYYIDLEGISVGNAQWEKVPKDQKEGADFNHPMFVDSGCSNSRLASAAFIVLVDLLKKHLKPTASSSGKKKHCFVLADDATSRPDVALHFRGGAAMRLPWSTYMMEPKKHDGASEFCTAITKNDGNISILGNPQQQNMHMLFDLQKGSEKLSFVPVPDCSVRKL